MRLRIGLAVLITLFLNSFTPSLAESTYRMGIKYFNQHRYLKASRYLQKAVNSNNAPAEAFYYLGSIYDNWDNPIAAVETYGKFIKLSPKSNLADKALYEMAKIYKALGYTDYALEVFRSLAYYYPNSDYCSLAVWGLGNIYYKKGNYPYAYYYLKQAPKPVSDRLLFWTAKSAEKMGSTPEAIATYQKIISRYDRSYYTYRSRDELQKFGIQIRLREFSAKTEISPENSSLDEALSRYHQYIIKGKYAKPISFASEVIAKAEESGTLSRLTPDIWRFLYPRGFGELVEQYAKEYGLDPHLAYAVIREESSFLPQARSHANARGLMQIIPSTGRKLSHALGIHFTRRRLYNPRVNIQMGTFFLSELIKTFNGNIQLALAAYNGGPIRVSKWLKDYGKVVDIDMFVEDIPFRETRNYVKKVMRSYYGYKRTYGGS